MPSHQRTVPSVTCSQLDFTWPDGTNVFTDLTTSFGPGRSGLIGVNGSGKSTLLRLVAAELAPAAGNVAVAGRIGYVRQDITLATHRTVAELLGVSRVRAALRRIEAGETTGELLEAVGDDWDVEERARATLDPLGLSGIELDRPIGAISGGEAVLLALAAELLRRPDVLLLDEPTNNLDRDARHRLYDVIRGWRRAAVIVTHDRELLRLVDQIGDLREDGVHWYGGGWDDYTTALAAEQEAARRMVRVAEQNLRQQRRELADARIKLDRRVRYGKKMWDTKREPKVVMGERKRQAQVSAGKHRNMHEDKVADAEQQLDQAQEAVRDDREIRIDLTASVVPAGRVVLVLDRLATRNQAPCDLELRGPERIALSGPNGAGKTTLLETIAGLRPPASGSVDVRVPVRYLPQRLDLLDPARTVAQNAAALAPGATDNELRAGLARFLFRGRRADQTVGTLSGGERFRATLAALLLAEPPPQLLLLDEPTNNLDLASVEELLDALVGYRGALIVASHDQAFLDDLGADRVLQLGDGALTSHPAGHRHQDG